MPVSGPLSMFGEPDRFVEKMVEDYINNEQGGVYLSKYDEKVPIDFIVRDTESSTKSAAEVAEVLATKEGVDMMLVLHTPATTVPVCGVAEKHGIPTVSLDAPVEAWLSGAPYEWSYHVFWSANTYADMYKQFFDTFKDQTNKVIGAIWADGPDGTLFSSVQQPIFEESGYELVFTGLIPQDLQDFTSIIQEFKSKDVEMVISTIQAPTFHRFMNQCLEMNFHPKVVEAGKAANFPSAMNALGEGDLPNGVLFECWWHPSYPWESPTLGISAQELAERYTEETGKQWTPPLGFSLAGADIVIDAIERAGELDKEKLRQAIANTDMETMAGPVDFKDNPAEGEAPADVIAEHREHVSLTPITISQWQPGDEWTWEPEIVFNYTYDSVPETADFLFPKPWPA